MPKVSDVYKSSYLRAADVEEPLTVTIKSASIEELGEDKDEKIVVLFEELDRGLVLNRTNADYLSMICNSDDTEDWPGTRVGLFVQPVSFKGKLVDSIRVTKPQHLRTTWRRSRPRRRRRRLRSRKLLQLRPTTTSTTKSQRLERSESGTA
jgi:hypothetical protein